MNKTEIQVVRDTLAALSAGETLRAYQILQQLVNQSQIGQAVARAKAESARSRRVLADAIVGRKRR